MPKRSLDLSLRALPCNEGFPFRKISPAIVGRGQGAHTGRDGGWIRVRRWAQEAGAVALKLQSFSCLLGVVHLPQETASLPTRSTCLGLWEPSILLEMRGPEPSSWEGRRVCSVCSDRQAGPPNPCFNLYGCCDFAWGLEGLSSIAALKGKTRQASPALGDLDWNC